MAESTTYSETECYIFVDHSNLWISGKKAHAKKLKDDTEMDHRFRVDLGKFLNLLANRRSISKAFLYGSVPPPNDSVWKAARERNFDVKTFQRSGSGREKELDVAMAHDITKNLYTLETTSNVIFIAVTGDRDLKPPIEDVLENKIHVELWSWEHSIAYEFKRLANTNPEFFSVKKLDEVQDRFSYTAVMSTRQKTDVDPAHAIVYKDVPRGKRFTYALAGQIARLMRLFYITSIDYNTEDKQDLIVQFPNTNPDTVLALLRKLGTFEYQPCSYPVYTSGLQKDSKSITTFNKYEALQKIDSDSLPDAVESSMSLDLEDLKSTSPQAKPDPHKAESCNEDLEDDWVTVVRRKAGRMTRMRRRRETQCEWGDHCAKASECPYLHSDDEKKLFEKYPKIPFRLFKTKECAKKEKHTTKEQKKWCRFAHDDNDSWCRKCRMYGHLTDNCKG